MSQIAGRRMGSGWRRAGAAVGAAAVVLVASGCGRRTSRPGSGRPRPSSTGRSRRSSPAYGSARGFSSGRRPRDRQAAHRGAAGDGDGADQRDRDRAGPETDLRLPAVRPAGRREGVRADADLHDLPRLGAGRRRQRVGAHVGADHPGQRPRRRRNGRQRRQPSRDAPVDHHPARSAGLRPRLAHAAERHVPGRVGPRRPRRLPQRRPGPAQPALPRLRLRDVRRRRPGRIRPGPRRRELRPPADPSVCTIPTDVSELLPLARGDISVNDASANP